MESKELISLQESLDKKAQSLISYVHQIVLVRPVPSSINKGEEISGRGINVAQIIIGGVVTASLGYAIAHYTEENEKLYSGIGAVVGAVSSYFVQKKKQSLDTVPGKISVDHEQYKREVLNVIRKANEQIREDWELAMKELTESQRKHIEDMSWTDEQKELATSKALVYKSMIINDYNYTDAIEDLEFDEYFIKNINELFEKWKVSISDTINNTKNEQWDQYFSKIYVH